MKGGFKDVTGGLFFREGSAGGYLGRGHRVFLDLAYLLVPCAELCRHCRVKFEHTVTLCDLPAQLKNSSGTFNGYKLKFC